MLHSQHYVRPKETKQHPTPDPHGLLKGEREADNKLSHYMLCTLMEGASAPELEEKGCALGALRIQCRGGRLREREAWGQFPDNVFFIIGNAKDVHRQKDGE